MKKLFITLCIAVSLISCRQRPENQFLTNEIPSEEPVAFLPNIIPEGKLIHKGIFSPDLENYYYTISDTSFQQFDIYVVHKENGRWSSPEKAFFNSKYNDHGMSFSPDGNVLYFSSTRPTEAAGVANTWHIWKSKKIDGEWQPPEFIDILNLRNKLVSHPTITADGRMYFHASSPDYSEMDLYCSTLVNGAFQNAEKVKIAMDAPTGKCTPFVDPEGRFLLFAAIGSQLDLYITFPDGQGAWTKTRRLRNEINTNGQGNPFVTADNSFLFFTTGEYQKTNWEVKWVKMEDRLMIHPKPQ